MPIRCCGAYVHDAGSCGRTMFDWLTIAPLTDRRAVRQCNRYNSDYTARRLNPHVAGAELVNNVAMIMCAESLRTTRSSAPARKWEYFGVDRWSVMTKLVWRSSRCRQTSECVVGRSVGACLALRQRTSGRGWPRCNHPLHDYTALIAVVNRSKCHRQFPPVCSPPYYSAIVSSLQPPSKSTTPYDSPLDVSTQNHTISLTRTSCSSLTAATSQRRKQAILLKHTTYTGWDKNPTALNFLRERYYVTYA